MMISLALPSVEHGSPMLGFQCAGLAAVVGLSPIADYDPDPTDIIYCRIAWLANLLAPTVMLISVPKQKAFQCLTVGMFFVLLLGLFVLLIEDHPGVTERYLGYYLWLLGLLVMGGSGVARVVEHEQSIFDLPEHSTEIEQ
ncbi:hypothetical protein [Bremerella volcania]|uniref:hypothetical protein n=1 Tax=Bremerella volcania TaxID=2527984 RepID=UPI00119FBB0E|nr:hypothetical protein [Bremerella volcania]